MEPVTDPGSDFDPDTDLSLDPGDPPLCTPQAEREPTTSLVMPRGDGTPRDFAAATDATGTTHLAYQMRDGLVETLRYAKITAAGTAIDDQLVHASADDRSVGRDVQIAIDASNAPHLAFVDLSATGAPTFHHAALQSSWAFSNPLLGTAPKIAIGTDGAVHLVSNGARYASDAGGSWMSTDMVLDGHNPSIAVAPDGTVHAIVSTDDGIMHAVRTSNGFRFDIVDGSVFDPEASGTQAAFDSTGRLHVVYTIGDEQRYAVLANGTWTREKIRDSDKSATSLVVLDDGRVVTTSVEWISPLGMYINISGRSTNGTWFTRGRHISTLSGDAALVTRGDAVGLVYSDSDGMMMATFDVPDGVDNDCDGDAW